MEHKRKMLSRKAVLQMNYEIHKQLQAMDIELEAKRLEVQESCSYKIQLACQNIIHRLTKIIEGTNIHRDPTYDKRILTALEP